MCKQKSERSKVRSDVVEAPPRFELGNKAFAELCLTTWLWRRIFDCMIKDANICVFYHIFWSGRRDSNSRRSPWQGDALPLSHSRTVLLKREAWCLRAESNHRHGDFQSPALPTELQRQATKERTSKRYPFVKNGDPDGVRTHDLQRDRLAF